jgi:ferritin-like metal-binding protein YciE
MELESERMELFFIEHLNRLYCAKAHLIERLEEFADENKFGDIKPIIIETIHQSEKQVGVIDQIFELLNTHYSFEKCASLVLFMEESFSSSRSNINDPYLFYILIISYLQKVESVQTDACSLLQLMANKMNRANIKALLNQACNDVYSPLRTELIGLCNTMA